MLISKEGEKEREKEGEKERKKEGGPEVVEAEEVLCYVPYPSVGALIVSALLICIPLLTFLLNYTVQHMFYLSAVQKADTSFTLYNLYLHNTYTVLSTQPSTLLPTLVCEGSTLSSYSSFIQASLPPTPHRMSSIDPFHLSLSIQIIDLKLILHNYNIECPPYSTLASFLSNTGKYNHFLFLSGVGKKKLRGGHISPPSTPPSTPP